MFNRVRLLSCALPLLAGLILGGCVPAHTQSEEEKEPHYLAGKSRVNAMDYKGAVESFEKALEGNPQSASAHFELGWLYDQKESDPAAAIFHYERYLKLRNDPDKTEMVKTRILACKQELARSVSLGPVMQSAQKELQQLAEENKKLRDDTEKLRAYAQYLERLTNTPGSVPVRILQVGGGPQTSGHNATSITPSTSSSSGVASRPATDRAVSNRTHTVKAGETLTMISRRYGVRMDALQGANPGIDPRRLKVGQSVVIPTS